MKIIATSVAGDHPKPAMLETPADRLTGVDVLDLPAHMRACIDGDWLILLDLNRDRYWAVSARAPLESIKRQMHAAGVAEHRAGVRTIPVRDTVYEKIFRRMPDFVLVIEAALWAGTIVKRGDLRRAFAWIEANKHNTGGERCGVADAHARFERLRVWIPQAYVCLFNALALCRFLLRRGHAVELVFGVRAMPFGAHCWVEGAASILDAGEEDCASFTEIARV